MCPHFSFVRQRTRFVLPYRVEDRMPTNLSAKEQKERAEPLRVGVEPLRVASYTPKNATRLVGRPPPCPAVKNRSAIPGADHRVPRSQAATLQRFKHPSPVPIGASSNGN